MAPGALPADGRASISSQLASWCLAACSGRRSFSILILMNKIIETNHDLMEDMFTDHAGTRVKCPVPTLKLKNLGYTALSEI